MSNPRDTQEPQTPIVTKETKHGVIIVDACDADLLVKCRSLRVKVEYAYASVYSYNNGVRTDAYLHRLIMARVVGRALARTENIDHENHNTLDCRRSNLRLATASQNSANRNKQNSNTSGFKGVVWHKPSQKWRAQITVNQTYIHLGVFTDPAEAHAVYAQAAYLYFGEFGNDGDRCLVPKGE